MNTPTPKTDKHVAALPAELGRRWARAGFARDLERAHAAALERIAELEKELASRPKLRMLPPDDKTNDPPFPF